MGDGSRGTRLGWVGTGRMGYSLVSRLLEAGHDVAVQNRTRSKAEPLAELWATVVDVPKLGLVFQSMGKGITLQSVNLPGLSSFISNTWYRVTMDVAVSGGSFFVNVSFNG